MTKLHENEKGYTHWCPACAEAHQIYCKQKSAAGAFWIFDGNKAAPTFTPSVRIRWGHGDITDAPDDICHYFLTAGMLIYLSDCTHDMARKSVLLPDFPEEAAATPSPLA